MTETSPWTGRGGRPGAGAPAHRPRTADRDRALAALAGRQHGVVARRQLVPLGIDDDAIRLRVRSGRLHRVRRGVYAAGHASLSAAGHRLAAVLAVGDDAAASHVTAAANRGLRATASPLVHVTVPRDVRGGGTPRVHRRPLAAGDWSLCDGIPTTTVSRTLVDLGDVVPGVQVRNAFVRAEQLRLLDMAQLDAARLGAARSRGALLLGEVVRAYDPRWAETRSTLELAFLDALTAVGVAAPEVNAWVTGRYCIDALWPDSCLAVEVDSRRHHDTAGARRSDARRDQALRRLGYRVIRVPETDLEHRPRHVALTVAAALAA